MVNLATHMLARTSPAYCYCSLYRVCTCCHACLTWTGLRHQRLHKECRANTFEYLRWRTLDCTALHLLYGENTLHKYVGKQATGHIDQISQHNSSCLVVFQTEVKSNRFYTIWGNERAKVSCEWLGQRVALEIPQIIVGFFWNIEEVASESHWVKSYFN